LIFAKNSIASFKIMKGDILGVKTTLRKNLLEIFIEKQIFIEHTGNRLFLITQK
jgi:ribosomal protein L5